MKTTAKTSKPKTEVFDFSGKDVLDKIISGVVRIADPDKIILFGSRATGEARKDSDYDILVLKKRIENNNDRLVARKIRSELNGIVPMDIVVSTTSNYEKNKNYPFLIYYEIEKTGKVLYEKA